MIDRDGDPYTRTVPRDRYRVRTWLRGHAPSALGSLFSKGPMDCGRHEWYRADGRTDRCYHCVVGVRQHVPAPLVVDSDEWRGLMAGIAGGSRASADILLRRLEEHETAADLAATQARRALAESRRR